MLTSDMLKNLVEDAVLTGLGRRYPKLEELPFVTYNPQSGVVDLMIGLPNGNLGGVKLSMRGGNYTHEWLDRLERTFPKFSRFLYGFEKPTEQYNKDIDWTAKAS